MAASTDTNHELIVELLSLRSAAERMPEGAARTALLDAAIGVEQAIRLALKKPSDSPL